MRTAALAAALVLFGAPQAAPLVGAAPGALRWKFDVRPDDRKVNCAGRIEFVHPKLGRQVYWYVVYQLELRHDAAVPAHVNAYAETDAFEESVLEGYYPDAMVRIRQKFGEDVLDCVQLEGREIQPGETVRAAAVFQFRRDDGTFEDDVDRIKVRFRGVVDPVKRIGLDAVREDVEVWLHFERPGDAFDAWREWVRFEGREERVIR